MYRRERTESSRWGTVSAVKVLPVVSLDGCAAAAADSIAIR
jgi:hypothetical protein